MRKRKDILEELEEFAATRARKSSSDFLHLPAKEAPIVNSQLLQLLLEVQLDMRDQLSGISDYLHKINEGIGR